MKMSNRILSLFLVFVLSLSLLAGCNRRGKDSSNDSDKEISSGSSRSVVVPRADGKTVTDVTPDYLAEVADKKEENSDTVGWLDIPGLEINDVVVCNFEDNNYYLRLNFQKEYDFDGLFYADKRSVFGDGSRDALGTTTCIYGHAMTDVPEEERFNAKFGPLHLLRDEETARKTPYIFFTTEKENLAFEIFAVFTADREVVPYNRNDLTPAEIYKVVTEQVLPRSIYNYDVEINEDDKFLTLSTCIYTLPNGAQTHYPDTYYRYAVMARLVGSDEPLKDKATLDINDGMIIDPDKYPRKK